MKKLMIAVMILAALLSGCARTDGDNTPETGGSPADKPGGTEALPDFSQTDFSGTWFVSGVIGPGGDRLSDEEFARLSAEFTLELLSGGVYFVYDSGGTVMGQGTYEVALNLLTCRAGDQETVYLIIDEKTLHCTAADDSVTIMERCPDAPADDHDDESFEDDDDIETDVPDEDTPDDQA